MGAKYLFTVCKGSLSGRTFTYGENESVTVGRHKDCSIVLPDATVSHCHCRIDIEPYSVLVRDLGSRNGTYLNGRIIGRRPPGLPDELWQETSGEAFRLEPGDRLGLGDLCELELQVKLAHYCAVCFEAMKDSDRVDDPEAPPICRTCYRLRSWERKKATDEMEHPFPNRQKIAAKHAAAIAEAFAQHAAERLAVQQTKCEVCGEALDENEEGLCATCRADPKRMLMALLEQAGRGERVGREIAGYRRIKLLGSGRWTQVWLVEEEASGRRMALKHMLHMRFVEDELVRMRFFREASLAGQLEHTNIVRYYKLGQCEERWFVLMELCEGGSLADLLQERGGVLDLELATGIILQVLDGLTYAHNALLVKRANGETVTTNGIAHRDINPKNILLDGRDKDLTAKVADFGLAKALAYEIRWNDFRTPTWDIGGTTTFMPREQYLNFTEAKPEWDVWSAAATYYHMLTGCFVRSLDPGQDMHDFLLRERVPIRQRNPAIPQKLAEVIDYALLEEPIRVTSAMVLKRMILEAL